jgi:hypothetical protein
MSKHSPGEIQTRPSYRQDHSLSGVKLGHGSGEREHKFYAGMVTADFKFTA